MWLARFTLHCLKLSMEKEHFWTWLWSKLTNAPSPPPLPCQRSHFLIPITCECDTVHGTRDFEDVVKLKVFRCGDDPGLPGGPNVLITGSLWQGNTGGRWTPRSERSHCALVLRLKKREGMSQASRSWKGLFFRASNMTWPHEPILHFWPPALWDNECVLFSATEFGKQQQETSAGMPQLRRFGN